MFIETEYGCFDNTGQVIALVNKSIDDNKQSLLLYSLIEPLKFDTPICTFEIPEFSPIAGIKFSNDGKVICLIGSDSKLLVIDAFTGAKKGIFEKV